MHTKPSTRLYTIHDVPETTMVIIHRALKYYHDNLETEAKRKMNWQERQNIIDLFDHTMW